MQSPPQPQDTDGSTTRPVRAEDCLSGGGEMGALMRATDWSKTSLGPIERWPPCLRTSVSTCLHSRFPMFVLWGRDLVMLYNDGYRPMLGASKHPRALGRPVRHSWEEIWDVIGPMLAAVYERGEATWNEDQVFAVERYGFVEECYFTFSYSPIRDEAGAIGGVFCAVTEETAKVVGQRRLATLASLAARSAAGRTFDDACTIALAAIEQNPADLPFSILYRLEGSGARATLVGSTGLPHDHPARAAELSTDEGRGLVDLAAATGGEIVIEDLDTALPAAARGVAWPGGARRAVALPLARSGHAPYGVLVAGVSPRLALDARYRELYRLVADQISTAIRNALAHEEEAERARALAELDRAKTTFFSNVSHELRTPLTLLLGPLEEMLDRPDATLRDAAPALGLAHRNARRILKLVNALLDFSRIEAGRLEASFVPTDLRALTADLASELRSIVESAGLRYDIELEELSEPVFVDRDMWEKIVLNLLSNAFKFTPEGSIRVSLRAEGDEVALEVADTGVGIAAADLPRIFERFHRVEGPRARTHEGTGIGLALVSELVRIHGGGIDVRSEPGVGTRIKVRVPFGSEHLPPERVHASSDVLARTRASSAIALEAASWVSVPVAPQTGGREGTVLVADDNADMRGHLGRLLGDRWDVVFAGDGVSALAIARARRPDVVLTDVMMPHLDGDDLLAAIRADPELADIPVIILSARAGDEARASGIASGASDYLAKPFSARELVARVATQVQLSTLRRRAERDRGHLRMILEQAPVAIAVWRGPEHVFELANERFLELTDRSDVVGRTVREAYPDPALAQRGLWDLLDRVFATGESFFAPEYEMWFAREDGTGGRRVVTLTLTPLRDEEGAVEGVVAVASEITELVAARERIDALRGAAEAASRAKDEFLAMLGHELRNPMAPIVTAVHLMRLRGDEKTARERATIERQVQHLVRLLDDLHDVSRVTRGKIELRRTRVEIAEVIASALEMAGPLIEQRRHSLVLDVPRAGLAVDGDPARLTQVVSNLLTNAAKYTEPGGRVEIDAAREDEDVVVRVRDDGAGISPEMLPRVFDAFAQERQPIDRAQGGLGLGLAIVRGIVELHGGHVEAHSEGLGRGTEMVVWLPALDARDTIPEEPAERARAVSERAPAATGLDVLVVDDNVDAADMLAEYLRGMGHRVRVAYDAPSALDRAAERVPDVALLDIGLPIVDGYELARLLRERPEYAKVPLVAVTGYGQDRDLERSRQSGFDAHLVKPVRFEILDGVLESITRPRHAP